MAQWYLLIVETSLSDAELRFNVKRFCPGRKWCELTEVGLRRFLAIAVCAPFNRKRERFYKDNVDFDDMPCSASPQPEDSGVMILSVARALWDLLPGILQGCLHRVDGLLEDAVGGNLDEKRLRLKKEVVAAAAVRVPTGARSLLADLREASATWIKRQEKYQGMWEKKVADGLGRAMGHMADAVEGIKETDAFHAAYQFQRAVGNAAGFGVVRCNPLAQGKLPREQPPVPRKRGRPAKKDCEFKNSAFEQDDIKSYMQSKNKYSIPIVYSFYVMLHAYPSLADNPGLWDCITPKSMEPTCSGKGWTLKINVGPRTWRHIGKFSSPHKARSVRDWLLMRFDVHRLFNIWPKIDEHLDTIRKVQGLNWDDFWSSEGVFQFSVMEKGKTFHAPVVGDKQFQMMQRRFTDSKQTFETLLLERQGIDADTRYRRVDSEEEAGTSSSDDEPEGDDDEGGEQGSEEEEGGNGNQSQGGGGGRGAR